MTMNRRKMLRTLGVAGTGTLLCPATGFTTKLIQETAGKEAMSPPDKDKEQYQSLREIAKGAYIYGFPMVDCYRIDQAFLIDPSKKAVPRNVIVNTARVKTPEDRTVQTPNSDTPYSALTLDLRAEPVVLTVPAIENRRYFSIQLIDLYTFNYAYIGSRATGNKAGKFLIAGPDWKGTKPKGIDRVIFTETRLARATYRTQLFNDADIENVKRIQSGYKAETLSSYLGKSPLPVKEINYIKPLTTEEEKTSLRFFSVLNFILGFCPIHASEKQLMERFAKINVGPGKTFDSSALTETERQAITDGMKDAWKDFAGLNKEVAQGKVKSGDLFGTRAFLKNNYLYRMGGAVLGIFGNSKEEAMYPFYSVDRHGAPLNGADKEYRIRFAPGQLPPVNAFWSLTMYDLPESMLVKNPLNRYLINSPMLPRLKKDADGGYTLYIQAETPGALNESNWLPAPKGPFFMALRLYWPKQEAITGKWKEPTITVASVSKK